MVIILPIMDAVDEQNGAAGFTSEVAQVLGRLRSTFADILAAVPGPVANPTDLHRTLRTDMKLSWQVFKVATAIDPLAAGPHVPTPASTQTFLKAAMKQSVSKVLIEAATQAAADFRQLVARHAGDRATFDSMVCALVDSDAVNQLDIRHRRAAFRANKHLWGTYAKTHLRCVIAQPSVNPDMLDQATIHGHIALRSVRRDAPILVSYMRCTNDDGSVRTHIREPIDPLGETQHGIGLIREFCSQPLPRFRTVDAEAGFVHGELESNGVGDTAAITCISGSISWAAVPRYGDDQNFNALYCARIRVPCEVLIHDVIVRQGTFAGPPLDAAAYGEMAGEEPFPGYRRSRRRPKFRATVAHLGRGTSALYTPDVPCYGGLARYVFDKLGWDADDFDVYRCRMEYPVLPSSVVIRFELSEKPIPPTSDA